MAEQEFNTKILSDESFRDEFKRDPKAAMRVQGVEIPDDVDVEVVESTAHKMYVVMPPLQTGELSDEQLASVSGGTTIICTGVVVVSWLAGC